MRAQEFITEKINPDVVSSDFHAEKTVQTRAGTITLVARAMDGRVKRAGASCKGSVADLRARARKYGGERGKMYHWCANMKSGRKKAK